MKLQTEIFGDVTVVHTPEELGRDQGDALGNFVATLQKHSVVLDLDPTESIDSHGLTSLVEVQQALRKLDGDLKISTTNRMNRKIFEITRLDKQLEVFDSIIEAVKSF